MKKGNAAMRAKTATSKHFKRALAMTMVTTSILATQAQAALVQADVDAIALEVTTDIGVAVAAGFGILAVSLASSVGMSLLGRFISKGANGG